MNPDFHFPSRAVHLDGGAAVGVFTVAVVKGTVEGAPFAHFASLLGVAAHAETAHRLGLLHIGPDGEPTATTTARSLYRRHHLEQLPAGRADRWSVELPALRGALAELTTGHSPGLGSGAVIDGIVLDTYTTAPKPAAVDAGSAASTAGTALTTPPAAGLDYDPAAAARTLVRLLPAAPGTLARGPAVAAAEQRRIALIQKVAALPALPPPDPGDRYTVRALTVNWLLPKSVHTERGYLRELHDWLAWCEHNSLDPLLARRADVDAWVTAMTAHTRGPDGTMTLSVPSNATIKHRMDAVSSWYRYLVDHERASRNPVSGTDRPEPPDHSPLPVLDQDEVRAFLTWLDARAEQLGTETAYRDAALIRVLFTVGLRVTGLCTAVFERLRRSGRHTKLAYTKKGGQLGEVPVPPAALAACERYWTVRAARENVPRKALRGPLFVSTPKEGQPQHRGGRALKQRDVQRILLRLATKAEVSVSETITPHSGRASTATNALAHGAAPRAVQALLGVRSVDTAMRYDRSDYSGDASAVFFLDPPIPTEPISDESESP